MRANPLSKTRRAVRFLSVLCLFVAIFFLVESIRFEAPREEPLMEPRAGEGDPFSVETPPEALIEVPEPEADDLPHDKLFITVERQQYRRGELRLVIPRISFDRALEAGTSMPELEHGPGLYAYAQLPGEGNRNVSIAGHRYKRDFYYIDTVTTGDYIYLADAEHVYRYLYQSSFVITPENWGPIYSQGYSCVTLTTCTPIGISDHRLIVRGELDAILPYSEGFFFAMSAPEQPRPAGAFESLRQSWKEHGGARSVMPFLLALSQVFPAPHPR